MTAGLTGIALMALAGSCGDGDRALLAPEQTGPSTAVTGTGRALTGNVNHIAFSPIALAKAVSGYDSDGDLRIAWAKDQFELDDDVRLEVRISSYGDRETVRVEKVKFKAKDGSIGYDPSILPDGIPLVGGGYSGDDGEEDDGRRDRDDDDGEVEITMQVTSGSTLSDVVVSFDPSGLTFSPAAELELHLKGKLPEEYAGKGKKFEIVAYHISGDGQVTKVYATIEGRSNSWKIKLDVAGFSEYDWDDVPEAGGPDGP